MIKKKILSKRQINRKVKIAYDTIVNEKINLSQNVQCSSLIKMPLLNHENDFNLPSTSFNVDILHAHAHTGNLNGGKVQYSVSLEQNIDSSRYSDKKLLEIREWALKHNITHNALTDILKIIAPLFDDEIVQSARSLLHTPRQTNYIQLSNGQFCYFGIKEKILNVIISHTVNNPSSIERISVSINIDGISLFKSSYDEFWPILLHVNNFNQSNPIVVGIFAGRGKPDPIDLFLHNFIQEINDLILNGLIFDNCKLLFTISNFVCDAPARSYLKQVVGHNSKNGCERCHVRGIWKNHIMTFSSNGYFKPRTQEEFLHFDHHNDTSHIKRSSPLLKIQNINLIQSFPLDPMHLVYLGVVRRLLLYLTNGKRPYKLSHGIMLHINQKIQSLSPYIPPEFPRKPRSLVHLKRWKATEFKLLSLYIGPIILSGINKEYYRHFLLLHCSIYILSNNNLISNYLELAKSMLLQFIKLSSNLYGDEFVAYNVHSLMHICDDVQIHGSLNDYNCFVFENYLGVIKNKIRSKKNLLQQIHRRVEELEYLNLQQLKEKKDFIIKPIGIFNEIIDDGNRYYECSAVLTPKHRISIKPPNNCFLLNKKIYLIKKIEFKFGKFIFTGTPFKCLEDLYTFPIKSSKLNIFYAQKFNINKAREFEVQNIECKCLCLPFKNGRAIFPINHEIKI